MSTKDYLKPIYWIKNIYPIVFFSCSIYVTILILNFCGIYNLNSDNPVVIVGYISLMHFFTIPIFLAGINGNSLCLMIFPYVNLSWIIAMIIGHFVIKKFINDSTEQLKYMPFHLLFVTCYFLLSTFLELMLFAHKANSLPKLSEPLESFDENEPTEMPPPSPHLFQQSITQSTHQTTEQTNTVPLHFIKQINSAFPIKQNNIGQTNLKEVNLKIKNEQKNALEEDSQKNQDDLNKINKISSKKSISHKNVYKMDSLQHKRINSNKEAARETQGLLETQKSIRNILNDRTSRNTDTNSLIRKQLELNIKTQNQVIENSNQQKNEKLLSDYFADN